MVLKSLYPSGACEHPVPQLAATLLSIFGALCFSGAAVLYRRGVQGSSISPIVANAIRSIPVLPFMVAAGLLSGASFEKPAEFYLLAFLSMAFIFLIGDSLLLYGLSAAPVGVVYPAAYSYPLFTALFAHLLLGENIKPVTLAAAVLIIAGVVLAYWGRSNSTSGSTARGVAAGLGASVSWGLGITLNQPALHYSTPVEFMVVRLLLLLAVSLPVILRVRPRREKVRITPLALGGLLGLGIGPLAYLYAIEMVGVVDPSVISSSTPVFALVLGSLVLNEKPGWNVALASVLVAMGVASLAISG